jgi:anti-anti-sigma factor
MVRRQLVQGLYPRVLIAVIVSITLVVATTTALDVRASQARLADELSTFGHSRADLLAQTSGVFLAQQNKHELTLIAGSAAGEEGVMYVAFFSNTGEQLAAAGDTPEAAQAPFTDLLAQLQPGDTSAIRWGNDSFEIAVPVTYAFQQVGAVGLRITTADLEQARTRALQRGIRTAVLLAAVLSLAVGLVLRRLVITPLRRLSITAEQIGAGTWTLPPGQERQDELGQLARSFGRMVETLQTREAQLQEHIAAVQALNASLDERVAERTRELNELVAEQQQLLAQIRQMSTPVVPVQQGVIVVPIVGSLDSQRAAQLISNVLGGIEEHRARLAVLDITGVPVVDTHVARVILQAARAAQLLGATTALVGARPEVAQTLVQIGVDLKGLLTFANLQEALQRLPAQLAALSVAERTGAANGRRLHQRAVAQPGS